MPEINPEVLPYINPAYWGVDIKEAQAEKLELPSTYSIYKNSRFMRGAFSQYTTGRSKLSTIAEYRLGDIFDPDELEPGAIVVHSHEQLVVSKKRFKELDSQDWASTSIPTRPTSLHPNNITSPTYEITTLFDREGQNDVISYYQGVEAGIVTPDYTFFTLRSERKIREDFLIERLTITPIPTKTPIEIGRVACYESRGRKQLFRVNAMDLVRKGGLPAKKTDKKLLDLFKLSPTQL